MDKFRWKGTVITVSADLSRNAYAIRGNIYSIRCMSRYPIRISLVRLITRWNNVVSRRFSNGETTWNCDCFFITYDLCLWVFLTKITLFFFFITRRILSDWVYLFWHSVIYNSQKIRHFIRIKTSTKRNKILAKHRQTLYSDMSQFCRYAVSFYNSPLSA